MRAGTRQKAVWGSAVVALALAGPAAAQTAAPSDAAVNVSQPDFTIAALPTTLRMPAHKSAFRVTHRFTRALGDGDFGALASNLFGFDSSARIGLEFRFGVLPGVQIGIHRTSDRTIQLFGQGNVIRQGAGRPVGVDALVTAEGLDNFSEHFGGTFGAVFSRELARHGALYVEPLFVANSRSLAGLQSGDADHTLLLGVGARLRLGTTPWYAVGELAPRLAGYDPGVTHASFGIERRVGGHSFQINFSNAFGTTFGQIAQGGFNSDDWYIGFNISRKFF
jgi:hypothetical protein